MIEGVEIMKQCVIYSVADLDMRWEIFENKVVNSVWKLYENTYTYFGIDYDDFKQEAYIILRDALPKYKSSKSGVYTFAINVLKRRMLDYIRNNCKTNKTKANYGTQSLNVPIGDDNDMEFGDMLVDNTEPKAYSDPDKIKAFIKKLSNIQKEILLLKVIGLSEDDSMYILDISPKEYADNIRKIKQPMKCNILRYERNEVV